MVQGQVVVTIDQSEEIAVFLAELGNAKKTNQDSVHDAPLISPHVRITFVMAEGETTAFAYEGILRSYLEFPYTGILQAERVPQVIQKNASRLGLIRLTKKAREIMSLTSKQRAYLNSQYTVSNPLFRLGKMVSMTKLKPVFVKRLMHVS